MITVRKTTPEDVPTVLEFIRKKAEFDRQIGCFDGEIAATEELIHKALFGDPVFAYSLLAIREHKVVGFAFFHFHFSSFKARPRLWLDDLFVDTSERRSGSGIALMGALGKLATEHECTDLAWITAKSSPSSVPFYEKLGAQQIAERPLGFTYAVAPLALTKRIAEIKRAEQGTDDQRSAYPVSESQ